MYTYTHKETDGKGTKKIPHMQAYEENFAIFLYFASKTMSFERELYPLCCNRRLRKQ